MDIKKLKEKEKSLKGYCVDPKHKGCGMIVCTQCGKPVAFVKGRI